MHNITIVSTIHNELGKCKSEELHNIIESLNPEVIFEELPKELFDWFYMRNQPTKESLEVKSVKKYLEKHDIKHIPVDISVNPNLSSSEIEFMFNTFKKYDDYKRIEDEQNKLIIQDGFTFLNSKKCSELFEKKKDTERSLLEFIANKDRLFRIYNLFYEEQDQRENEIINNIYNYSEEYQYNQAILLIGSGHRKSIVEKIKKNKSIQNINLNWILYGN